MATQPLRIQTREHDWLTVSHNEFNGKSTVSVRYYTTYPDLERPVPTKRGVNIQYGEDLQAVIDKLVQLQHQQTDPSS